MSWLTWPFRLLVFLAWYARELVLSNVAVLRDNLTPGQNSTPGIARFPTSCRTDHELTVLAALITLTPGTLTIGTATTEGTRLLFVHGMYHRDAEELRADLQNMETHMLRAIRRRGGQR